MLLMRCQSTYMIKSESMPCNKPNEITRFSHAVVRIFCTVAYYLDLGACDIQESDVKIKGTAANCVTIASAVMCRFRNTQASALHYSISTVLSKLTTKSSFISARKVDAFCKQASNASSPSSRHSDVSIMFD